MFRKISIGFILPILIIIGMFPTHQYAYAESNTDAEGGENGQTEFLEEEYFIWTDEDEEVPLYDDFKDEKEKTIDVPHKSLVLLSNKENKESEDFAYIRYIDEMNETEIDGYVEQKYIINEEEFNEMQNNLQDESEVESDSDDNNSEDESDLENESEEQSSDDTPHELEDTDADKDKVTESEKDHKPSTESTDDESDESKVIDNNDLATATVRSASNNVTGVAKKSPTNVRQKTSTKSKIIKQFHIGQVIKYKDHSKNWNQIIVNINGKEQIGYIHKKHVTNVTTVPKAGNGVAKKSPTNIRTGASTKSKILDKLSIGEVFEHKSFSKNWYEVTVNKNGKKQTGYIHKKHFTNITTKPKSGKGVAKKSPTNIRTGASTKSKVLGKLAIGEVFEHKSISKNWYKVTVDKNNKKEIGYIHKKHFTNIITKPKSVKLVTKRYPTNVRTGVSTKSNVLQEISPGEIINAKSFSKNWYEYTNSKNEIGYIHRKHVDNANTKSFQGTAIKKNTNIRTKTSTKSKILTTVSKGTIIDYKLHSKNWYKATVKVNGKSQTGYIHKKHIEEGLSNQKFFWATGLKDPTNVRTSASTKSKVLTTFALDEKVKLKPFTKDWFKVDVKVNGKEQTGYMHRKHIENINGKTFKGVAKKKKTYIRTKTSTKSKALKTVPGGTVIEYKPHSVNWYKTTVKVNGKNQTGYIHKKHISSGNTVFLDAGHGGSDPGSSGNGLEEKDLTLDITERVKRLLENNGFIVKMSRIGDQYKSLSERTDKANKSGADIFVSIHINAGGGTGIETWNMSKGPKPKESNILAQQLQKEVIKETNVSNRGVKDGNLHVNRESQMPSSLVEIGFIDTKSDADKLKTSSFKQKAAKGIFNGIKSYFKLVH